LTDALHLWLMLGENLYVNTSYSLETDARCETVAMQEMKPPLLVYSMHLYSIKLSKSETNQVLLAFGAFYSDQLKDSLGNNQRIEKSNLMIALKSRKLMLHTFSFLNASTVWKLSVLLVVLLLLGLSLTDLRVPPRFYNFLNKSIPYNPYVLTISVLIKPANFQ